MRFKRIMCESTAPFLLNYTCAIKAYSRTLTALNISIFITKKWEDMFFSLDYKTATSTSFREVMNHKEIDWCSLMAGTSGNVFYSSAINLVRGSKPEIFHECPYEGNFNGYNISVDLTKYPSVFPSGTYRSRVFITDSNGIGFNLNITCTFSSHIKSTY
ncbi:unnamed protein product [Diamesa tonsa]